MPTTLTDADIDRHDAAGPSAPQTLSDADIDAHDQAQKPSGNFVPFTSAPAGSDIAHPQLGPSPTNARMGNEVFRNLEGLPAGVWAFLRHPIDTTKAYIGEQNLEHPEKSSGLLGAVDVLGRKVQAGQTPEAIGDILTMALPGTFKEGGLEAAGGAIRPGVIGTAIRGGIKGGIEAAPNAIETSLLRYTGLPQLGRGIIKGAKQELARRAAAAQTAASPGIRRLVMAAQQAPAPESVLPESVTADLTRPSEVTPPPTAAQPPAEATAQLNTQVAKPGPVPVATRMAATARAARSSTADTLAQALENEGMADVGQTMPVFRLGDFARLHKIEWPTDQTARINLLEATRTALRQRRGK